MHDALIEAERELVNKDLEIKRLEEQYGTLQRRWDVAKQYLETQIEFYADDPHAHTLQGALDALTADGSFPAKSLHELTTDDSENEPPDLRTSDDFGI